MNREKNIIGKRFSRLVVIEKDHDKEPFLRPNSKGAMWKVYYYKCKCDCGNIVSVRKDLLKNISSKTRGTQSCGCLQKEAMKRIGKEKRLPIGEAQFNELLCAYRRSARKRNISFDLSKEEFKKLTKQECFYCGEPPSQIFKSRKIEGYIYIYNGIDRIDSDIGYKKGNTVSCCKKCNISKHDMPQNEFFEMVKKIYRKHNLK